MAGDVVLSRELSSLQEELSASRKERAAPSATADGAAAISAPPIAAEPIQETPEKRELQDQLRELVSEVTSFFEEAEKSISAHPAQSVAGALLVGILIGRVLGRR